MQWGQRCVERGSSWRRTFLLSKVIPAHPRGWAGASLAAWLHPLFQSLTGLGEGQPDGSAFHVGPATLVTFQSYLLINLDASLSFSKVCCTSEKFNFSSDEIKINSDEVQCIEANSLSPLGVEVDA